MPGRLDTEGIGLDEQLDQLTIQVRRGPDVGARDALLPGTARDPLFQHQGDPDAVQKRLGDDLCKVIAGVDVRRIGEVWVDRAPLLHRAETVFDPGVVAGFLDDASGQIRCRKRQARCGKIGDQGLAAIPGEAEQGRSADRRRIVARAVRPHAADQASRVLLVERAAGDTDLVARVAKQVGQQDRGVDAVPGAGHQGSLRAAQHAGIGLERDLVGHEGHDSIGVMVQPADQRAGVEAAAVQRHPVPTDVGQEGCDPGVGVVGHLLRHGGHGQRSAYRKGREAAAGRICTHGGFLAYRWRRRPAAPE